MRLRTKAKAQSEQHTGQLCQSLHYSKIAATPCCSTVGPDHMCSLALKSRDTLRGSYRAARPCPLTRGCQKLGCITHDQLHKNTYLRSSPDHHTAWNSTAQHSTAENFTAGHHPSRAPAGITAIVILVGVGWHHGCVTAIHTACRKLHSRTMP
jgi:hypothetical protein